MKPDLAKYRKTFFDEAAEHAAALEGALLRLEKGPHDPDVLDAAFRAAHSVKGGADAVGLPEVARFTHALEDILDQARSRPELLRPHLGLLLEAEDVLTGLLGAARADGPPPDGVDDVIARLVAARADRAEYAVRIVPTPGAFLAGLDPLPLLRELAGLGEHLGTDLDASGLPPLAELNPEQCHLAWTVRVRTSRPAADLEAVFAFARDNVRVAAEPVGGKPAAPPAPPAPPAESAPAADNPNASGIRSTVPPPDQDLVGLIGDFCTEAVDHLEAADRCLLTLDTDPTDREALNSVYRGFHSIKGVASMLGMKAVQTLAHEAENLLNLARDGKLVLRGPVVELVFASVDALKRRIALARQWAAARVPLLPDPLIPDLLTSLREVCVAAEKPPSSPSESAISAAVAVLRKARAGGDDSVCAASAPAPAAAPPEPSAPTQPAPPRPADAPPAAPPRHPEPPAPQPAPAPMPTPAPVAPAAAAAVKPARAADKETVRVDKERLDKLINAIGELVIAQSMAQEEFHELTRHTGAHSRALPELTKISRDLQELSLSLRMVPLQGTFQKMTRLVRDLSKKIGKPVDLVLHGEETELDKTVVDQLGDPLMHMVRNAVDHGLESPDERLAAGKPSEGRVTLRAYHQGGNVYIELTDDGRGLDRDRLLAKAVEKGLVAEGQRLSDSEAYALIFAPGFSTAKAVTDVSGRGVGMDVVRRNVEALQGNILIRTQLGKGTTFTIRLPLTLAIMDGLMVGLGDDVYVLPLLSVVESFRPRASELRTVVGRGEVVNVRGEVIPLVRLHRILGRDCRVSDPTRGLVVLVEDQGKKHALLVDELLGQMQAVIKSLDANYQRVEGLAGATILGDGRVAMILDIHGLTRLHTQSGCAAPLPACAGAPDDHDLFGDAP